MEVQDLVRRWQENDDEEARDAVIERTLPLARRLARRYAGRGEPLEDLEQVAAIGLVKAIDRFDADRCVQFASFARPTITGELKRHFRDRGWMLRVPRDVQELALRISAARRRIVASEGRQPTVAELCVVTESSEERVLEALQAAHAYRVRSLDVPLGDEDDTPYAERFGGAECGYERAEERALLETAGLHRLAARDQAILRMRYVDGLTQREIARRIGISQMHVSRRLARSVEELREGLHLAVAA